MNTDKYLFKYEQCYLKKIKIKRMSLDLSFLLRTLRIYISIIIRFSLLNLCILICITIYYLKVYACM